MTDADATERDLVASRAEALTPEELEAGVDDPETLARAVLGESEERLADREGTTRERRRSEETVEPVEEDPSAR